VKDVRFHTDQNNDNGLSDRDTAKVIKDKEEFMTAGYVNKGFVDSKGCFKEELSDKVRRKV